MLSFFHYQLFSLHMHAFLSLFQVTDDHFKELLAYIEGLRGSSRVITLQKAEVIVRWEDKQKRKMQWMLKRKNREPNRSSSCCDGSEY